MVNIQGYNFQGPWVLGQDFNDIAGVYVIYTSQNWLDVGETDKFGERMNNHERKSDWIRVAGGLQINIAFYGVPNGQQRLNIESSLRAALSPLCGDK